jgi:hypothetical protein
VYCDKVNAGGSEGILFNFYLPGVWADDPFTAKDVALMIRDNTQSGVIVENSFGAPETLGGELAFYMTETLVEEGNQRGQIFMIKVARLGQAVYSSSYSKVFNGPPDALRDRMRAWLVKNLDRYSRELNKLQVDAAWVPYLNEHCSVKK